MIRNIIIDSGVCYHNQDGEKGPNFDVQPDFTIGYPIEMDSLDPEKFASGVYNIGDINGDGWEDLSITFQARALIYFCGMAADTLYDVVLDHYSRYLAPAGDINGDGFYDLISGTTRSSNGSVDIYLGSNRFDVYTDDYILRTDLPPLNLEDIGYRVSSAGDFNGDGLSDFMFACQNFFGGDPGDVFIIQGSTDYPTDIQIEYEPTLPADYQLSQNYPNPFNPSTTIEFSLPSRGHVSLNVFNTLSEKVVALLNKQLSVGLYKVTWDGRDYDGNEVASGVYFYKLESGEFVESKKMMLLR